MKPSVILAAALGLAALPAHGQDEQPLGAEAFAPCRICHSLRPGENKVGPSLHGLFGRKAGSLQGYPYSRAMRRSGLTWTDDTLARYLADPKKFVPGNKMAFPGIKDPNRLGALLDYLKQATR